jgi:tetratricopeptide (TPR) repeat protein
VKSRTAVERYRMSADDPAVLGRALGVAYLVNGSVRRAGQRLRVTVELVRAATGAGVWGDQYDRGDADLLATEEDIALAVARAVAGQLLPQEKALLAARPTRHPEAYDHLLRGNYELARRTPRAAARAIDEYQAAVRLDPGFTRALARISYAYALFLDIGWRYPGLAPESLLTRGLAAVERALEQDSTTSDAWMARGYLLSFRYPHTFDGVRSAFDRAIALDPGNAEAHHQYGGVLRFLGDDSGAVRENRRALDIEPERPVTMIHLASISVVGHQYAEARRWMDSALAVDPGFRPGYSWRALIRVLSGDREGARSDAETAVRLGPDNQLWGAFEPPLVQAEAQAGDTASARARLDRLLAEIADPNRLTVNEGWLLGTALVALGEHERALELLERVRPRGGMLWFRLRWPAFDALRAHPRFQRLVEESRPPGVAR